MNNDRKRLLALALGVAWIGIALYQYATQPDEREVSLAFVSGQPAKPAPSAPDALLVVRPLQRPLRELGTSSSKNIFAPLGASQAVPIQTVQGSQPVQSALQPRRTIRRAPVVAVAPVETRAPDLAQPPPPVVQPVHVQPPPAPEPVPIRPPSPSPDELAAQAAQQQLAVRLKQIREQMAQYQYLGFQSLDGERRAFLGKDNNVFVVRLGDKVDGRFMVQSIDSGFVKLREPKAHIEMTLELKKDG